MSSMLINNIKPLKILRDNIGQIHLPNRNNTALRSKYSLCCSRLCYYAGCQISLCVSGRCGWFSRFPRPFMYRPFFAEFRLRLSEAKTG